MSQGLQHAYTVAILNPVDLNLRLKVIRLDVDRQLGVFNRRLKHNGRDRD
jgi:hypothetical protein